MEKELGSFEGKDVQAGVGRFSGRVTSRVGKMHQGEVCFVIAKVFVSAVNHKEFKSNTGAKSPSLYSRIHDLSTSKALVLDEADGAAMFEAALTKADEKFGIESLFNQSDEASHLSVVEEDDEDEVVDLSDYPLRVDAPQ